MILACDAGNSRVKLALFEDDRIILQGAVAHAALASWARAIEGAGGAVDAAWASVAPALDAPLEAFCRRITGRLPVRVSAASAKIGFSVERPESVGPDRIANAVAARALMGAPCLVIDFGSATTATLVDAAGNLAGGLIAPGVAMGAWALHQRTGRLPLVDPDVCDGEGIGRDTGPAIRAGLVAAAVGFAREAVRRVETAEGRPVPVVLTGGASALAAPLLTDIARLEPDLTLHGVRLVLRSARSNDGPWRRSAPGAGPSF